MLSTSQPAAVIAVRTVHTNADVTVSFVRTRNRARVRPAGPAAVVLVGSLLLAGCAAAEPGNEGGSATGAEPQATASGPAEKDPAENDPAENDPAEKPVVAQAPQTEPSPVAPAEGPVDGPPPATGLDLSEHSTSDPASPWVIVNKHTPLDPVDHEPDLTTVRGYLVRRDAAPDVAALLDAADADGVRLTLRSAYRGYPKQASVYEGWVAQLGAERADEVSARPGHSEHQTGLGVDVGGTTRPECDFEACFGETVEGRWVANHAAEFGMLVRYTRQNSAVTGYAPEPWHLRWVGRELAAHMRATGVTTLEEVFDVPGGDYTD
ncbi:D-alanyl-D-alanine carboxypeptidase family protein [Promicromonospora sp. NPDC023805]|uniref:D-alanyl-D-alanine carboxypeptidase family protein n=1 Tax=Promicromonospora sp. NPDC023805 TaxID=3154696 RepID=UPI0033EF372A